MIHVIGRRAAITGDALPSAFIEGGVVAAPRMLSRIEMLPAMRPLAEYADGLLPRQHGAILPPRGFRVRRHHDTLPFPAEAE